MYIQGSGSWSSSLHSKVASGLSAEYVNLTLFWFLYLAFPLMLTGQGYAMTNRYKHVINENNLLCMP